MATTRRVVVRYSYLLISVILIVDAIATILLLSMGYSAPSVDSWMLALAMLGLGIGCSVLFIRDHRNNITDLDYSTFSMILLLGVASLWIILLSMDIPKFIKLIRICL